MQREPHRGGPKRPETEHRLARPADPEKGCGTFRHFERDGKADDITVKGDCPAQVADREMGLEQTADRNVLGHRSRHGRRYSEGLRRSPSSSFGSGLVLANLACHGNEEWRAFAAS